MKRSRAFILSEQLMTIMLQAGFILVLCTSFYQLISFYTRTQQVLTARNHAERVISFMDEKIRNAGLGLWRCKSSSDIRAKLGKITMLSTLDFTPKQGYRLPIALQNGFRKYNKLNKELTPQDARNKDYIPLFSYNKDSGNIITLLYAQRDMSTGYDNETISAFKTSVLLKTDTADNVILLDNSVKNRTNLTNNSLFKIVDASTSNIKSYAVMEGFGYPLFLVGAPNTQGSMSVMFYSSASENITVPAAGDLLALNCMQMFVHGTDGTGEGRQFAFRELQAGGTQWDNTYNQEKGILDIYMELDKEHRVLTLWVLASGGYDASLNNPRPETWPEQAEPTAKHWGKKVIDKIRDYTNYPHHIVYVSRASWKLNNIPPNFGW